MIFPHVLSLLLGLTVELEPLQHHCWISHLAGVLHLHIHHVVVLVLDQKSTVPGQEYIVVEMHVVLLHIV